MWVKQCHKPPMAGNGKFIPKLFLHIKYIMRSPSKKNIWHIPGLIQNHMEVNMDPQPSPWLLKIPKLVIHDLDDEVRYHLGNPPYNVRNIWDTTNTYRQFLGGCEALTAGSPAALKLGRPRPKMPSKGPGSTRVAMENQPNLHQDVGHVHLAMMAVSTFLICSFFHKGQTILL